jgi:lysine/ornithine N-monooxygenase
MGAKDKKTIARAEYGKYCKWVEENNLQLPAAIDKYLHRDAVDQ